jgi:hypothetical protein
MKLAISQTNKSMTVIFEPALLPWPYVIINELSHYAIFAQQGEHSMPFRVLPRSSSFFAFDAPFAEPAIMLTISGKSQLVPLHDDVRGSYLPFTIGGDRFVVDLMTLSNGTRALIIGLHPYVEPSTSLLFSLGCGELTLSLSHDNVTEYLLICAEKINWHFGHDSLKFTINSLQVDELISMMPQAVVLRGDFVNSTPFFHLSLGYNCNLHNLPVCTLLVQPIYIAVDALFLHDFTSYIVQFREFIEFFNRNVFTRGGIVSIRRLLIHPFIIHLNTAKCRQSQQLYFTPDGPITDLPERYIALGIDSLSCEDLSVTQSCLRFLLLNHIHHAVNLSKAAVFARRCDDRDPVVLSRFQCSFIVSEFYSTANISIADRRPPTLSQLPKIAVFPHSCIGLHTFLEYGPAQISSALHDASFLDARVLDRQAHVVSFGRAPAEQKAIELLVRKSVVEFGGKLHFIGDCGDG